MKFNEIQNLAKDFQEAVDTHVKPPSEIAPSQNDAIIYFSLVRGTRGYIERVAHQVNGTYANGWYDACAVMLRRLLETLIIECFESHSIGNKIKDTNNNFRYLRDLIDLTLNETSWNLGRNVKTALPKLKDIGDKSAHSRRYNAHREDIDKLAKDIRDVVQELVALAGLK
ncbi:MAG TPA: DUF4145 domain-containing protein [Pyrinomonadaceae bacterium]|nr:DUF4145 domain-containing protein [Pyrinomonadaceae bacterium]